MMQEDPSLAELQSFWSSVKKYGKRYGPTALRLLSRYAQTEDESPDDSNAKEQHSFHFYDKAAKQDDEPERE